MLKKVLKQIDPDTRISHYHYSDSQHISAAYISRVLKKPALPLKNFIIISVTCRHQPYVCNDADLVNNFYTIPIYESSDKDTELSRLGYLLDYLSLEDDLRPVRYKFHTYPVHASKDAVKELVETDEDILNLFKPRDKLNNSHHETIEVVDEDRSSIGDKSINTKDRMSKDASINNLLKGV